MACAKVVKALCAAGAILLLAAGCGGGGSSTTTAASHETSAATTAAAVTTTTSSPLDKSAYSARMRALSRSLNGTASALATVTGAADAARLLTRMQGQMRTAADDLAGIDPPASVRAQHERLVEGIRDFAAELDAVISKLKGGNYQALQSVRTLKGLAEIKSATDQIAKKGFKIAA